MQLVQSSELREGERRDEAVAGEVERDDAAIVGAGNTELRAAVGGVLQGPVRESGRGVEGNGLLKAKERLGVWCKSGVSTSAAAGATLGMEGREVVASEEKQSEEVP